MSKFVRIGSGHCGSVWAPQSHEAGLSHDAYKHEDRGLGKSVEKDYKRHKHITTVLGQHPKAKEDRLFNVPKVHSLIRPNDPWWATNLDRFPPKHIPLNTIHSERIPPIPTWVRNSLIDRYSAEGVDRSTLEIDTTDARHGDTSTLLRPYLGHRRAFPHKQPIFHRDCLRNFPLHLDQLEVLVPQRCRVEYAHRLGVALATLHWLALVDAGDVEFVLAPPRSSRVQPSPATVMDGGAVVLDHLVRWMLPRPMNNAAFGEHAVWVLDFDLCGRIGRDWMGARTAARKFMENAPYFPRPDVDLMLWETFKSSYLLEAAEYCIGVHMHLPELVIAFVEIDCKRESDAKSRPCSAQSML